MIALSDYYPGADDDAPRERRSLTSIALQLEQAFRCNDGREWIAPRKPRSFYPKPKALTLTEVAEFEERLRVTARARAKLDEIREINMKIIEEEERRAFRGPPWVSPRVAASEIDYVVWRLA